MMRILVFGNAGSGKTTLARRLGVTHGLAVLDLDDVVWSATDVGAFRPDAEIVAALDGFVREQAGWVIEGCYGRWIEFLLPHCTELILLDPGLEACLEQCRRRPWEPHKYPGKEAQDAALPALLDWVRAYYTRADDLSLEAHRRLFASFQGSKHALATPGAAAAFSILS